MAIASGIIIVILILIAFVGAPIAKHFVGHGPNDIFASSPEVIEIPSLLPAERVDRTSRTRTRARTDVMVLGAANRLGQDEFLRLLYGARVSLEVALFSTIGVMIIGVILGSTAGYFRGATDTVISRVTEIAMAFPVLLFVIALAATVGPRLNAITFGGIFPEGVVTLVLIFTIFGWFYPARIMRAQVLSIREKEYMEAARMIGASDARIIRSHVLPHLIAPMIVYSTLIVASYVLARGRPVVPRRRHPADIPSWGNLLSSAPEYYTTRPLLMVWPGLAVLIDHARLQPAGRRPAGRVRSALDRGSRRNSRNSTN